MAEPITVVYKNVDGLGIKLDVYPAEGAGRHPVIFWIHGGALISGGRVGPRAEQLAFYREEGFALVSIDYRLAPETKLPGIIEDVRDAYAWMRGRGATDFGLDRNRIAVAGHSAGGYLTLMTGFCVEPRPKALVSFYGYGDLVGGWYSRPDPFYCKAMPVPEVEARAGVGTEPVSDLSEPGFQPDPRKRGPYYLWCRQNGKWPYEVTGFEPDTEREHYRPYNPVWNVTTEYPPTILLHGDLDTDVPYAQSVLMAYEMQKHDVPHELYTPVGGGHGFDGRGMDKPEVAEGFERVRAFLRAHV